MAKVIAEFFAILLLFASISIDDGCNAIHLTHQDTHFCSVLIIALHHRRWITFAHPPPQKTLLRKYNESKEVCLPGLRMSHPPCSIGKKILFYSCLQLLTDGYQEAILVRNCYLYPSTSDVVSDSAWGGIAPNLQINSSSTFLV